MSVTARAIRETSGPTVLVMGAVADGQALVRSGSTIIGGTAGGGAPTGSAGGDLGGTYPNPTVLSIANVTTGTLPVARGGTGLTAVGSKFQVLQTDEAATAMEWGKPFSIASVACLPIGSASLGATNASFVGVPAYGSSSTIAIGATSVDRIYALPWIAPYTKSVGSILWELTTGDAGKVANFALYESDADGYPSNRIAAVSSVSLTTTGVKTSTFSAAVTVQRGRLYWLARTSDSLTAALRAWISPTFSGMGVISSASSLDFTAGAASGSTGTHLRVTATYAVPPATFPTGAALPGTYYPIMGLF
jgi:hypothetical protein